MLTSDLTQISIDKENCPPYGPQIKIKKFTSASVACSLLETLGSYFHLQEPALWLYSLFMRLQTLRFNEHNIQQSDSWI